MTSTRMFLLPGRNGAWYPRRIAPPMSELHGHRSCLTSRQPASYRSPTPARPICRAAGRPLPAGRVTALIDRYLPARRAAAQSHSPGTDLPGPARRRGSAGGTVRILQSGMPAWFAWQLLLPLSLFVAANFVLLQLGGDRWIAAHLYLWEGGRWALQDGFITSTLIHE